MFNLIQLFLRLSGIFVFLILELICFSLVVKYNQTQQEIYSHSVNEGTGFIHRMGTNASQYFSLDDENYRLTSENAFLLERLLNANIDTSGIQDTAYIDSMVPQYTFLAAKVVKNSVNQHHNYIVLDVGAKDGVKPHSGVITANGVVGIVRKVSNSYSVVMSVLHRQTRVSARIRGKHYFGPLTWTDDNDVRKFSLGDIPQDATLSVGDTVETSGYSAIFPEGLMLGVISKADRDPSSYFYSVEVRSSLDISNIQHVYVVTNLLRQEQEELEQAVLQEDE